MPNPPQNPPAPPGDNEETQGFQIDGMCPGYVYIHSPLPDTPSVNSDKYAKDCKHNLDVIPNLLTDERTSTG
jgi:hypothetical protein